MKTNQRIMPITLFVLIISTGVVSVQEAARIFEKALFLEESQGDLDKAITLYEKIVKESKAEQDIAAKAQLHIGRCYKNSSHLLNISLVSLQ